MRMVSIAVGIGLLLSRSLFVAGIARAQASGEVPQVTNTKLEVREVQSTLRATVEQVVTSAESPMWFGYEVEEIRGEQQSCCGNYGGGTDGDSFGVYRLEGGNRGDEKTRNGTATLKLEGPRKLWVLVRAEKKRVEKIQIASQHCELDAGGLRLVWIEGVKGTESVAWLSEFVRAQDFARKGENGFGEQALTAIALHADGSAEHAFESFVAPGQSVGLREKASFWLGATRGEAGLSLLKKIARNDPSDDVRAQVSFALSVSQEAGATDEMIRMAHEDESAHVRGQALFWLAQKAGKKAESAITGAIADDPDTEVKKKAVFALSQMPREEGVPKLIEVAQTNRNPEIRKQAMFWLGQSNDPRALEFFEKILRQ
jgi:HEAT repeats